MRRRPLWQSADPTDAATTGTRDRADHDGLLPGTTPGSDVVAQWTGHDRVRTETRDVLIRGATPSVTSSVV
ncbi:hypothetical protein ACFXKC_23945 [Streptomyces sp. NPDC059340]|uniref:hypothetical protein n=1 Tax=Streptomyces sp. NPDC059340 TaxID=3346806 RepID=UPI0036CAF348